MKLYYAPGACSQAPHIILHETGLSHEAVKVDLKAKTTEDGRDYGEINPKGSVPAIELDNGEVLTENAVVLQYLGDRSNLGGFLPPLGDFRRYRVLEWLNFITTELHKGLAPIFKPDAGEEVKAFAKKTVGEKLDHVEKEFAGPFLMGDDMTLGDPYLFVITGWAEKMLGGLDRWPKLAEFRKTMMERKAVRAALKMEGLLKEVVAD
jgi:glutathione S-transferase